MTGVVGLQISDHLSVYLCVDLAMLKGRKIDLPGAFFENVNPRTLHKFVELIHTIDWSSVFLSSTPDDTYNKLISLFKNVCRQCFPTKRIKGEYNPVSLGLD